MTERKSRKVLNSRRGRLRRGQIDWALQAIDHIGESKYQAKQEQGWQAGEAVEGQYSHGYKNTVFDRATTLTNWLREQYPAVRIFRDVDHEMITAFLSEKAATCTPDTVWTLLATLKKLQEGLYAMKRRYPILCRGKR